MQISSIRVGLVTWLAALLMLIPVAYAQSSGGTARLQSLVNDTAAQFQLAYRHNVAEHQRRREQLSQAIAAWRAAAHNDANNRRLTEWLRAAIRSSMPGSRQPLAPLPEFDRGAVQVKPAPPSAPAHLFSNERSTLGRAPATVTEDKSAGDPFGDDPRPEE